MYIRLENIRNWPDRARRARWRTNALAKDCSVSVRTLQRFFICELGKTPKQWLIEQRQIQGAKRLREGLWVKEVAADLGYNNAAQFSRDFKEYWGVPAVSFRRVLRKSTFAASASA